MTFISTDNIARLRSTAKAAIGKDLGNAPEAIELNAEALAHIANEHGMNQAGITALHAVALLVAENIELLESLDKLPNYKQLPRCTLMSGHMRGEGSDALKRELCLAVGNALRTVPEFKLLLNAFVVTSDYGWTATSKASYSRSGLLAAIANLGIKPAEPAAKIDIMNF